VDEKRQIYEKSYTMREPSYLNLLMTLSKNGRLPSPLLRFLVSSPTVDMLNSKPMKPIFKSLYVGLRSAYKLAKRLTGRAVA
jgi:anaerobic magnesium-protoporphyrin IX monomethyl ester cyclase